VRVVVVDDEPLAREHLISLLADESDVEVVGEAGRGSDAVHLIRSVKPEAVFLDVQMPGLDGFGVLRAIPSEHMPLIVFVTAYDEHAVNAFEVSAVDYLLKPVLENRLRVAVRRVVERALAPSASEALARLSALAELLPAAAPNRVPLSVDGRVLLFSAHEIDWVDASDDHIRVHAAKATHVVRETMASIESRLGAGFVRIHRSTLVNARRIREIQPWVKGDFVLILHDGTRLTSGRTYREHVRALLP